MASMSFKVPLLLKERLVTCQTSDCFSRSELAPNKPAAEQMAK